MVKTVQLGLQSGRLTGRPTQSTAGMSADNPSQGLVAAEANATETCVSTRKTQPGLVMVLE
jgi:hypothetical protein